jgi:hypothetical protein
MTLNWLVNGALSGSGSTGCRLALAFWCESSKNVFVKTVDFKTVKRQEARSRIRLAREAARSPEAAAAIQKRVSLVGNGAKWKITNFKQFARATAQWA